MIDYPPKELVNFFFVLQFACPGTDQQEGQPFWPFSPIGCELLALSYEASSDEEPSYEVSSDEASAYDPFRSSTKNLVESNF